MLVAEAESSVPTTPFPSEASPFEPALLVAHISSDHLTLKLERERSLGELGDSSCSTDVTRDWSQQLPFLSLSFPLAEWTVEFPDLFCPWQGSALFLGRKLGAHKPPGAGGWQAVVLDNALAVLSPGHLLCCLYCLCYGRLPYLPCSKGFSWLCFWFRLSSGD